MECSPEIQEYFDKIEDEIKALYEISKKAKAQGLDPEDEVAIPYVKNMAERVEGLISIVAPQIVGSGVAERIKELEEEYGSLDWRISLIIAVEIAEEKYCKFKDKHESMEVGIRAGLAYHTMGVVASPLEGFVGVVIRKTKDNKDYFALKFSGPIRSAGGTGASVCVLIADYVRKKMGYAEYDPTDVEIKRMVREVYDFHERITNLQYLPSEEEIEFMVKNLPVQIDGDPSEKIEVSNYKDLDRIDTNQIRNGICLVIGEALSQKSPKLWKQLSKWGHDFDMQQWDFLGDFVALQKKIKAGKAAKKTDEKEEKVKPDFTFIKDLVAGRPVFTHPLRNGGFRLRYGRSRTSGFSSNSVNPATMYVLNQYCATATQLKMERPGKACSLTACDVLEGPIVKLEDNSVLQLNTLADAKQHNRYIKEILYLGDMLVNYGDFFNRAHILVPPGYCVEWWTQEIEKQTVELFGSLDLEKLSNHTDVSLGVLQGTLKNVFSFILSAKDALALSTTTKIPLAPYYSYFWNSINKTELQDLFEWLKKINIVREQNQIKKLILPFEEKGKRVLELLAVPHLAPQSEFVVIEEDHAQAFFRSLHLEKIKCDEWIEKLSQDKEEKTLDFLNKHNDLFIRDRGGVFLGARMGRPEKAKMRQLTGSPHCLFPVGEEGGRLRSFQSALEAGKVQSSFPMYKCNTCNTESLFRVCETCNERTKQIFYCRQCKRDTEERDCPQHGPCMTYKDREVAIATVFKQALKKLNMRMYPELIKGVRGTSNKDHIPEHLIKGILRAKHEVHVNKDGTTRYDMSEMGITHFKPFETGTTVERLRELGYTKDIDGKNLEKDDQIVEIKPQDILLPSLESPFEGADKVMFRVANFIDDLLVHMYGLQPYYKLKKPQDLVGHLMICLAPHTSAAIVARVIGFTKTQGFFSHPLLHAAQRRDLDGDESCVCLLLDALLNFSRQFLPAHRGSTQDAPLVLTSKLIPAEVDDMVFDMDIVDKYPLAFYEACLEYKNPWDVKVDQIKDHLGKPGQYEGMMFTHPISDINNTVLCSAYKILPSMQEKLEGQMQIAAKVRAVDKADVARLVIEKHFIRDTKGNLRKFSMQQFRCVNCNEKYRRPPLIGRCVKCKGKLLFTISQGSIVKYLAETVHLAEDYDVPVYLKQTIHMLQRRIDSVFGKEKEKQVGLLDFA